ncbi:DUF1080 domain-containing protein [Algoriphagus sp. AK58]|uniref:3-keto-disaccharide hydrolase n=1 Tax=Algoriphagus sp. AK58 TaxID=1406877 RepID=UPI00164F8DE1|nr:DUF1080 domain-containing protein [Algoriphagus sp. AK58]MBC6366174.1 hypothetical protein [Algoriphagus sp. AK58]
MIQIRKSIWVSLAFSFSCLSLQAQTRLSLSSFEGNNGSWSEVAKVWTDPLISKNLSSEGQGSIILNNPDKKRPGTDIISKEKFGDAEVTLVYMMAPGSNSGIYLQGRYEVQLLDSWLVINPKAGDNGGIYERWDESKPEGQKGYQGYAPRQNASKAPGTWQTLNIKFKAPRFSANGEKIENAKIESVTLNGILIHQNVILFGPTRGALSDGEVSEGPIRIQGDHGPVAIKSLEVKRYDTPAPEFSEISYKVFPGSYTELPAENTLKESSSGKISDFNEFVAGLTSASLSKFEGVVSVKKAGNYTFRMSVPNGSGAIRIGTNSDPLVLKGGNILVEKSLQAGEIPFVIWVSKPTDWTTQGFLLTGSADGMWEREYSYPSGMPERMTDPILVDMKETPVLRSFIELPSRKKISHGISVSSQKGAHYSYDLNANQLLRVWRGMFLDATPMWNDRGNGISRPLGTVTELNEGTSLFYSSAFSPVQLEWKPKGYQVLADGDLRFFSSHETQELKDRIQIMTDGKGLNREIELTGNSTPMMVRVAPSQQLFQVAENLYWLEESGLFLKINQAGQKPLQGADGLFLPITTSLSYSLLF